MSLLRKMLEFGKVHELHDRIELPDGIMIITKDGFDQEEDGEYRIESNAVMSTLAAYWLIAKRYSLDDLFEKGISWYPSVDRIDPPVTPREFFNFVYIEEMLRDQRGRMHDWSEGKISDYALRGKKKNRKLIQRFASMVLEYYSEQSERIGSYWFWKSRELLPLDMGGREVNYGLIEHNGRRRKLDFAVLDETYEEFSKLKLVYYGFLWMVITKGEVRVTDLREPRPET